MCWWRDGNILLRSRVYFKDLTFALWIAPLQWSYSSLTPWWWYVTFFLQGVHFNLCLPSVLDNGYLASQSGLNFALDLFLFVFVQHKFLVSCNAILSRMYCFSPRCSKKLCCKLKRGHNKNSAALCKREARQQKKLTWQKIIQPKVLLSWKLDETFLTTLYTQI